jgi:hypothetical protein
VGNEIHEKSGVVGEFDRVLEGTHHASVWEANSQDVERDEHHSTPNRHSWQ